MKQRRSLTGLAAGEKAMKQGDPTLHYLASFTPKPAISSHILNHFHQLTHPFMGQAQ